MTNQLDHEKSRFRQNHRTTQRKLCGKVVLIQYPVTAGPQFNAVVDVLKMKCTVGNLKEVFLALEIPDSEIEKAQEYHNALVESAAEHDEALMEKFFDQGSLDEEGNGM